MDPDLHRESGDTAVVLPAYLHDVVGRVAASDAGVLLRGERGVGKHVIAREVHRQSPRSHQPFVKVNCAALPASLLESELFGYERGALTGAVSTRIGQFEAAHEGSILLDDITDMAPPLQAKLLQVLQDHEITRLGSWRPVPVNVRVIAATIRDVGAMLRAGAFRADLYYRLQVIEIYLPALRERRGDIPALANYFVKKYASLYHRAPVSLGPAAIDALVQYTWPGNIRELENLMRRFVILQDASMLPARLPAPQGADAGQSDGADGNARSDEAATDLSDLARTAALRAEKAAIERALTRFHWNRRKAAESLRISYKTLLHKMKECGIRQGDATGTPAPTT